MDSSQALTQHCLVPIFFSKFSPIPRHHILRALNTQKKSWSWSSNKSCCWLHIKNIIQYLNGNYFQKLGNCSHTNDNIDSSDSPSLFGKEILVGFEKRVIKGFGLLKVVYMLYLLMQHLVVGNHKCRFSLPPYYLHYGSLEQERKSS